MENTKMTQEVVYYSGKFGNVKCTITSKLWSFGGHHIPFNSISDVVATKKVPVYAIVLFSVLLACGIGLIASRDLFYKLGIFLAVIGAIGLLFALSAVKEGLFIYSSSGQYELIERKGGKECDRLYRAMLACLKEGNVPEEDTVKCPECGMSVSKKADKCPNCGCPAEMFNKL